MKLAILFLVSGISLLAQIAPAPAPTTPFAFVAFGGSYNPQASPKAGGWFSFAYRLANGTYSYSTMDATIAASSKFPKLNNGLRTGVAQSVGSHRGGVVRLFALVEAGVATTGTNTGGAGAIGAVFVVKPPKASWSFVLCGRRLSTAIITNTQTVIEAGWGIEF